MISNPLTSELLSLSSLSLCPLCPLWFNHSDTTGIDMTSRRLQSLFHDRSIVLGFLLIALVVSVLLFISKASLFETSAIAQIPTQSPPSNPWKYQ